MPGFLPDLAQLEWAVCRVSDERTESFKNPDRIAVNPTLQLIRVSWSHLPSIVADKKIDPSTPRKSTGEFVLVWKDRGSGHPVCRTASDEDLLALKLVVEETDSGAAAAAGNLPVGAIESALQRAVSRGILLAPPSRIRRDLSGYPEIPCEEEKFVSSAFFTLQWHVTQKCDLRCKHCYDRSDRSDLRLEDGIALLDGLGSFCRERHVKGQVSFTGGNPLLYPHFHELYRAASELGLATAILGNPASREEMEKILSIKKPVYFQVSLEGLRQHNDSIRGRGSFSRTIEFLKLLRQLGIPSKVMLTLTEANMDQVIPLGETLRGLAGSFTFNRLSLVGSGAGLRPPPKENYESFLKAYMRESRKNRTLGWKDSLINILCRRRGLRPFGGCTGYGCGAAFNFISVLSDGEAHACRKFPSPIGNVFKQTLAEIYDSPRAERYRSGPEECRGCDLRIVCRGCLASTFGEGLDVFKNRDPYCFVDGHATESS